MWRARNALDVGAHGDSTMPMVAQRHRVLTRVKRSRILIAFIVLVCCAVSLIAMRIKAPRLQQESQWAFQTASATPNSHTTNMSSQRNAVSGVAGHAHRKISHLVWNHTVYLPITKAAVDGFQAYDARLRKRLRKNSLLNDIWGRTSAVAQSLARSADESHSGGTSWDGYALYDALPPVPNDAVDQSKLRDDMCDASPSSTNPSLTVPNGKQRRFACSCLMETPECAFFLYVGNASVAFVKCCVEHYKLKLTFRNVVLASSANKQGLQLFLDSGSLLSSVRDGGSTLLPWETDIDLGVVGASPSLLVPLVAGAASRVLRTSRPHIVEMCAVDAATGRCKDAHYVYFVTSKNETKADTCRVEIWPLHPQEEVLHHPTRPWLNMASSIVLPLRRCALWGIPTWCPGNSVGYLDHEYDGRQGWIKPKTIHWGERNIASWG